MLYPQFFHNAIYQIALTLTENTGQKTQFLFYINIVSLTKVISGTLFALDIYRNMQDMVTEDSNY